MSRHAPPVVVLKFGSSVLQTSQSLPIAVAEIYRHYRAGERVVAVVSAFEGVTDALCAAARAWTEATDSAAFAAWVSTGEITSATQLTLALQGAGIPSQFVDPRDMELKAAGPRNDAALTGVAVDQLHARFAQISVLVVPGFFARSEAGGLALLGRGGSDLTALYLADVLKAKCVLLKDVDGLYESDPAQEGAHPARYVFADYPTAEGCAGSLVQAKAVRFARERSLALEIARVGTARRTRIGEGPTMLTRTPSPRPIRVALLGLGHVGGAVLDYLNHFPDRFHVVAALVRTPGKHIARGVEPSILTISEEEVFARNPDVLVEALPGTEPARTLILRGIKDLTRIVTANKAVVAAEWAALAPRLLGPLRQIRYAAAVGGAVPMVELIERLSLRSRITRVRGVLNGTANFVLDRCAAGDTFTQAVERAQVQGFAENDPGEDLSGRDAARKIELLGRVAFGGVPRCDELSGISAESVPADAPSTARLRLVAEAQATARGFTYRVSACELPLTDFLAGTCGATNRLEVSTADGRIATIEGAGAGGVPTATAMFADLLEHARLIEAEHSETVQGLTRSGAL